MAKLVEPSEEARQIVRRVEDVRIDAQQGSARIGPDVDAALAHELDDAAGRRPPVGRRRRPAAPARPACTRAGRVAAALQRTGR